MAMPNRSFIYLVLSILSIYMLFYMRNIHITSLSKIQPPVEEELVFLKPFVSLIDNSMLAINYKVQSCSITKSMSQLMFNTMCYLDSAEAFADKNLTFSSTWYDDRSHCLNITTLYHKEEIDSGKINLSEYVRFAFVREPMDRFRSFYMDKCISEKGCFGCVTVLCAAKKSYEILKRFMDTGEHEMDLKTGEPTEREYMTVHASPQTWNCEFGRTLHDYKIIHIGASIDERKVALEKVADLLRKGNVPERHVARIFKDALTAETIHSTHNRNESQEIMNEIENNPEIRKYLYHIYYYDYIAFGFNMTGLDESYLPK